MKHTFFTILRRYMPLILLGIILVLGTYLRLYRISEYMTFLGDEGRDMLVIKHMIVDHKFTLLGPTASVGGFFLGPIYYYFMLPFVWAWGLDPSGAAVMVALFGIATIYLIYRIGRDMFDEWVGLVAASIYACSPIVIAYSRSSWNPNLVPFFSALLIYFLWRSVAKREPKLLFWVGIVLGIGLQLHYLFLFLFPVVGIWYLWSGRKKEWLGYYFLGMIGFLVGYGPFLAFEFRHGFPNTISIYNFLREGKDTGLVAVTFWKNIADVSYRLFGRLVFRLPPPEQWVNLPKTSQYLWDIGIKWSIFSSLGLLVMYCARILDTPWKTKRKSDDTTPKHSEVILLLLWFVVPVILFGLYKKGIYDYYFGLFFSLPFLFVALVLRSIWVNWLGKIAALTIVVSLLYFNWQGRPFIYIPNNQLEQARTIAKAAYEKTQGRPYNFALLANFNSDHAYRYFFEIWGNPPVMIENAEKDPQRRTVTDQLIIICELPECKPLGHPLWEVAGFGRAEIVGEWPVSFVKIMKLIHFTGKETL